MKRKMGVGHWWNDSDREKPVPLPLCHHKSYTAHPGLHSERLVIVQAME